MADHEVEDKKVFDAVAASALVNDLRATFASGKTRSYDWRAAQLNSLLNLADKHEKDIVDALHSDLAKPELETVLYEITLLRSSCKFALKELKRWMKPEKAKTSLTTFPSSAEIVSEPLGVVLVISAWNYPFLLSLDPVIGAIAAGCAVVLKPSELSPATSSLLAKLVEEYLDSSCIKVVEGAVEETSALLEQKWDKICYTGNGRVGRIVMSAAAKHLTPVLLELGGKSPVVVDSGINVQVATRRIIAGKWGCNNGQACISPDYIITTKDYAPTFCELEKFYGKNPLESKDLSRIVNSNHYARLTKLLDDDKVSGKIVYGGERDETNLRIAPTILLDVPRDSLIMNEEIFGPLLPILTVDRLEESFDLINFGTKPLAAYMFTTNKMLKEQFVKTVSAGGIVINDTTIHLAVHSLPFGGVGESGLGVSLSRLLGITMDLEMEDLSSEGPDASIAEKLKKPEVAPASHLGNYDSIEGSVGSFDPLKKSTSESINNVNSSNSDLSYHDNTEDADDVCDDLVDDDEYVSDYYDDDDDFMYEDNYSKMQAQFDNVDLPTGVEVSLPWLKGPAPAYNKPAATSTSSFGDLAESSSSVPLSAASSSSVLASSLSASASSLSASASSSSASAGLQSDVKADVGENGVTQNSQPFKPFDTVEDFSDHHYSRMGFSDEQPPKNWAKRIQDEWKILEKNLPDTIFVRVYESRMELLRAVIIGPQGTPYHDGLFVFDCLFPTNYPDAPPMVYYYSGGLRLNPNLYECGKVCLSLLGTWSGKQTEMWIPGKSTMLQVLVSIQALILNAEPFYNEPGYEKAYSGPDGDMRSNKYSEDAFVLSLKTMIYTIRKPPKHFEEFVAGHFRNRACDILIACKAYTEGARVGSVVKGENQDSAGAKCTKEFRSTVAKMMNMLVTYFTKNGSTDCEQFRIAA